MNKLLLFLKKQNDFLRNGRKHSFLILIGLIAIMSMSFTSKNHYSENKELGSINNMVNNQSLFIDQEWILDTTINKVSFYHKIVNCGDKKAVLLQFNNLNVASVNVSFKEIFTTKQVESGVESYFGVKEINLTSGFTSPASCDDLTNPKLVILPQQVDPTYLSDILTFSFKEIKVVQL